MAMSVMGLASPSGDPYFYSPAWRQLVETHLDYLRVAQESEMKPVSDQLGWKYEGDFFGVLTELRIPQELHWITLRLNGLISPIDFDGSSGTIMVPSASTISRIVALAQTVQTKIA